MSNLRIKWVGRWSPDERQFRFFRVMWERMHAGQVVHSCKLSVSVKNWLPRITLRRSGGIFV